MSTPEIMHLSVGTPRLLDLPDGILISGILKEPVQEAYLSKNGFLGDGVANLKYHGGPERAVCFYCAEHYPMWEKEFDQPLPRPAFGENLTVKNMLEQNVHIGDIYRIGGAIVQITQGRIPCNTISKRNGLDQLLHCIIQTGFTGYFARVLEEGQVTPDAKITLIEKDPGLVSILYANHIFFHDRDNREGIARILEVEALAPVWREKLSQRLRK